MVPAWDPATPRSKHLRFSIIWGRAWGFNFAIYILFDKKKGANHYPMKQERTSSILSLPLLCVQDVSWRTLKMLKEYQQRLFSKKTIVKYPTPGTSALIKGSSGARNVLFRTVNKYHTSAVTGTLWRISVTQGLQHSTSWHSTVHLRQVGVLKRRSDAQPSLPGRPWRCGSFWQLSGHDYFDFRTFFDTSCIDNE